MLNSECKLLLAHIRYSNANVTMSSNKSLLFKKMFHVFNYSSSYKHQVMKVVFVFKAKIKFSFSILRHKFYLISGLALVVKELKI